MRPVCEAPLRSLPERLAAVAVVVVAHATRPPLLYPRRHDEIQWTACREGVREYRIPPIHKGVRGPYNRDIDHTTNHALDHKPHVDEFHQKRPQNELLQHFDIIQVAGNVALIWIKVPPHDVSGVARGDVAYNRIRSTSSWVSRSLVRS